ncbi:MAG: DUF115 domain-containing protein [Lachnospiraceae bacterium]|nr:DUF115 domain-containing protein [Lachnospiraceae bacterium]
MSNKIFEKNMEAWEKKYPGASAKIKELEEDFTKSSEDEVEVFLSASMDETPILQVKKEDYFYYLAGKREPKRPAEAWADSYKGIEPATVMIMVGMGNPFYFKYACEKFDKETSLIIFEPSMEVFLSVLSTYDLTKELDSKRTIVFLVKGLTDEVVEHTMSGLIDINMLPLLRIYALPNYKLLFKDNVKEFLDIVLRLCEDARVGLNTNLRFAGVNAKNLLANARYIPDVIKTKQFIDYIPRDIPAIIVAAGPSLNKNIKELKRAKGKSFIIACDTAIKPLLKEGIVPDMFALVDGKKPLDLIKIEGAENIPLLASVTAASAFFDFHKGRKIIYNEYIPLINRLFIENGIILESVPCGGSVATTAFAFAYMIGMKTIILVGQDLALTGNKSHADGTFKEKMEEIDTTDYMMVPGNCEEEVPTRPDFHLYLKWYNYYIQGVKDSGVELRVINATEGGAKIDNTEIMTLKEAIDETCHKEVNIEEIIDSMPGIFDEEQKERIRNNLRNIPAEFEEIHEVAEKLQEEYKKLDTICKKKKFNQSGYLKCLKRIKQQTKNADKHVECMNVISESLKVADFILKSEENLKMNDDPKEEGLSIARQGIIYSDLLAQCSKLLYDYTKELYEDKEIEK